MHFLFMLSMRVRIYVCTRFIFLYWRCCVISNREHQINEEIKDKEIRLIGVDGSQLGIVSADEALELAFQQDLDLVKIAPQAQPPVCRIMDYGNDTHDFNTKVNQAIKFLNGGDKLKVSVRFRKRTVAHPQFGEEILAKFKDEISEAGVVDKPSKMEGRSLVMFVSPKQSK